MRRTRKSDGFATVEWTVALALGLLLVGLAAQSVSTFLRFSLFEAYRARWHQESALAGAILSGEVGRTSSPADWLAYAGDSLTLRAFRGHAWICGHRTGSPSTLMVVYQGDRNPNPAKDSVLIHSADGGTLVAQLSARRVTGSNCGPPPGRPAEEWVVSGPAPKEGILRLFESGTYSVSSAALRYRVGRGGRQPVAGAQFDSASTLLPRLTVPGGRGAVLSLASTPGPYQSRQLTFERAVYSRRSIP